MGRSQNTSRQKAPKHEDALSQLADQLDRLTLVVDSMWQLLAERGYSEESLFELIGTRDAVDGRGPEGHRPRPIRCPKCESMVEPGRERCSICGALLPD